MPEPIPVIFDTDIGWDPDDFFALLLALNSPELDLKLIVTSDEVVANKRAAFARRILRVMEIRGIPIAAGADLGGERFSADDVIGYGERVIPGDATGAIKRLVDRHGRATYVGVGGFTNIAAYLAAYPDDASRLRIVMMGGAIGYSRRQGWIEHNVKLDVGAARSVLSSGADVSLVMAQTTMNPRYEANPRSAIYEKLMASRLPEHKLLASHVRTWREWKGYWSYMHDPLTVAAAMGRDFFTWNETGIAMDEEGNMAESGTGPRVRWTVPESKAEEFMRFLEFRLFGR